MKNMDNHRRSDMKRWKHVFKKGMAFVLSLAMVAGLVLAMSGGANTVQAATGSGTEPSVTAYATKDQLMTAFNPDSNGDATTIGKLVFGKNSSSVAQEWHILGKDEGVSGDNTIIFAASPIATKQAFEDDDSNKKTFASSFGVYETNPSDVYPNHYGASDLRVALKNMATNTSYFTTAEQGLMNPTTVRTNDILNSTTYTTTDKLYALTADGTGSPYTTIKAGSDNNTVLAESSYWRSGECFWLRSPSDYSSDNIAMLAYPGKHVYGSIVRTKFAVQPASNLDLSSVLFASAATAASSDTKSEKITDSAAMTLRLDGTGKDIGTATYNTTTGDIKAVKGATSQTVALVVQGNDGTNNWYYSKKITGTDVVNVSDIVAESNTPASIDLSACKIWLEITEDNVTYVVNATETVVSEISSVAITDIATPVSNTALDAEASCVTEGVSSTTPQITWTPSDSTAGYNTSYTASITLTAATGYEFTDSTTATVLGNNATSITKNTDGTLTVTYDFPATAKDKLISITAPQAITVANGTAYDAMNLPATVNIVTEGNTESSAPVTWNTTAPASGSYEPSVLTQQTVTLNGTVTCPDSIDDNGVLLTTTITITISAAGIVGAPTVNLAAGTYTENQSVTLTSSTEGATIYYTTDGSEPTITGGVPAGTTAVYTAPIAVTGTEGESITTTIKAIAVKDRMQNSSVEKFTYTIQIPVPKYEVNVTNGSGSGNYAQGSTVTITANTAPNGQRFKDWSIESGNITLASSTSDTTTFVMPAEAVRVKANYEAIPTPVSYKILDGANSDWKQNTEETITIRGNGDFSKFVGVKIDGNTIDAKNYTAKEGSTIITLTTDYLKTLSIGTHTFEIVWTDGSASTNFTVSKNDSGSETPKDDDKNKNDDSGSQTGDNHHITAPQTGDNSHLTLWISLLGASLIGLLATLYMRKKKDNE
jgi:bacterial group 3 Ig-like protein